MNQYGAYIENIKKEDSIRVAHILANRRRSAEMEEEKKRMETFRASEQEAAERRKAEEEKLMAEMERQQRLEDRKAKAHGRGRVTAADRDAPKARKSRLAELSKPKEYGEAMYGSGTYGKCLHQRSRKVEFPEGRGGTVYMPGVDRDRFVPTASQRRLANHSKTASTRGARLHSSDGEREAIIAAIERGHQQGKGKKNVAFAGDGPSPKDTTNGNDYNGTGKEIQQEDDTDSVFSHSSSNGPIKATGVTHMRMQSDRNTTVRHLQRYGGSMTAPHTQTTEGMDYDEMPLEEVTARIVKMQSTVKRV